MKNLTSASVLFALALGVAPALAGAQNGTTKTAKTGEQVYQQACVACHATGVASAPKLGDKNAWAPLIEEGQDILTAHAWVGVRAMPAQGGATDLTLAEFADAVAWMASASGGNWKTPDADMMKRIRHEAAERLDKEIKDKKALKKKLEHN
ncbi:MAG: cytochrome c5 family protein [Pusillimonas sp.]